MKISIQNEVALAGRILLSILFLWSGFGKVSDPSGTIAYITHAGLPLPSLAYAVALLAEVGLPLILISGWKAKQTATLLALFTLATAFCFHTGADQQIQFYKNIAIAGGFLQIAAFGAGSYTIQRLFRR